MKLEGRVEDVGLCLNLDEGLRPTADSRSRSGGVENGGYASLRNGGYASSREAHPADEGEREAGSNHVETLFDLRAKCHSMQLQLDEEQQLQVPGRRGLGVVMESQVWRKT